MQRWLQQVFVLLKASMACGEAKGSGRTRARTGEVGYFVALRVGRANIVTGGPWSNAIAWIVSDRC